MFHFTCAYLFLLKVSATPETPVSGTSEEIDNLDNKFHICWDQQNNLGEDLSNTLSVDRKYYCCCGIITRINKKFK